MTSPNLTEDSIPKLIRHIAIPSSVGFFFNTMYNFVDTYCAGLISTDALAALSLSFPVFFILLSMGSGLSQGTTALMANAIGEKNETKARLLFAQAILLASTLGIVLTIIGVFVAPSLFQLLGARDAYLSVALQYMNVILAGGVFFILQMTINAALNAQGDTKLYRNYLIGGFFANCILNPILAFGWFGVPAMGVAGIALATVLVQVAGCWILWRGVHQRALFRVVEPGLFKPDVTVLKQILAQAGPAALNMLTVALGIFIITWFISQFSKEAVAGYGIATRIEQVVLMPTIGLNFAVLSLVGQNNGAGRMDRVHEAWLTGIRYGVILMLFGGALVYLVKHQAMGWFTTDPEVIARGSDYLGIAAITLCAYPILFQTMFLLQGLKRPAFSLWIGLYRQILAPKIVFHLLAFGLGWQLWGVWWGIFAITWSAALFTLWWGSRVLRRAVIAQTSGTAP